MRFPQSLTLWTSAVQKAIRAQRQVRARRRIVLPIERLEIRILPATLTWQGDVSNLWGDGDVGTNTNWVNGSGGHAIPQDGDILIFPNGAANLASTNNIVGLDLAQLRFNGLNYNISGNAITLSGGIMTSVPAGGSGDRDPIFSPDITLVTNNQTIQANSVRSVNLQGDINLNGVTLTVDNLITSSPATTIAGDIGGSGALIKNGTGTLILSGANTYAGVTTLNAGILLVRSASALGATGSGNSTTVASGAALELDSSGLTVSESLTLNGTGVNGTGALRNVSGNNTWAGSITLGSFTSIGVDGSQTLTIDGAIESAAGLSKVGTGTLELNAANTYTGSTQINAGTLLVNGAVAQVVFNGDVAALAGNGTVAGVVTASVLGASVTLRPGAGSTGILTSTASVALGDATFGPTVNLEVELGSTIPGSGHDQLNIAGSTSTANLIDVNLDVALVAGFVPVVGSSFRVINNGGTSSVNGTFNGLPQGATFNVDGTNFQINYAGGDGNDVVLTVVFPPTTILAIDSLNNLIRFDSATPGTIAASTLITGVGAGQTIVGMDFRPADGQLYLLTNQAGTGRLYTLNPITGVATLRGTLTADPNDSTNPFTSLSGNSFGVDFNPVPDRLRVVSNADQNLRINVTTGLVITDDPLNPGNPNVVGSAYTNSIAGATTTTLFGIDSSTDSLVIQNPPNNGTLTTVGAGLGVNSQGTVGFDIQPLPGGGNRAFATISSDGVASGLYSVDLAAGTAALVGSIGSSATLVTSLAVVPEAPIVFAVDAPGTALVSFSAANPAAPLSSVTITGLQADERIAGIDFRPATGQLYALGIVDPAGTANSEGRIYTINTSTGAATQVGSTPFSSTLVDGALYGFDFNPIVDRIRIVNNFDQNLRVNPNDGSLAATDTVLNNTSDDEEIVAVGYDRSGGGPALTTLFGIDFINNSLIRIGGVDGNPSPNGGDVTTVGSLGLTSDNRNIGLDIDPISGVAFASITDGATGLYLIDLASGAATRVDDIGDGATAFSSLAVQGSAIVVAGTAGNDTLVVTATGTDSGSYSLNGGPAVNFFGISSFTFHAGAGDDTLRITNPVGGVFAPEDGIFYNGQGQASTAGDALILEGGGGALFSETFAAGATADAGTIVTTNAVTTQTITFTGLEPITDTVPVGTFNINLTSGADAATIIDGAVVSGFQTITVADAGSTFNDFSFANKSDVNVNGLDGADVVDVNFTITATGLSTLDLFGSDATGAESDDLAGDTFNVNAATAATVSAFGQGGNDSFVFATGASIAGTLDGGADIDTIDYSSSTTGVSVNLGTNASGFTATLGGDQEVPANGSAASGTATLTYNSLTGTFDISVMVSGIAPADVLGFHLHQAAFGVNGAIIVNLQPLAAVVPAGTGFTFAAAGVALPDISEAALLGGIVYVNVHTPSFPGGEIRGQVFADVVFTDATGTADGTGGISNIENATGSSAADSLVGNGLANLLQGGNGNDTLVAARGNDTVSGGENDDVMVWSNGDGTDVMNGNLGTDLVQVNGSATGDDVFTVGAGVSGRVDFDRTSPGPFSLDIGTTETLTVNGIGGNDSLTINSLAGVTELATVNFNGLAGDDQLIADFSLGVALPLTGVNFNGGTQGTADSLSLINGTATSISHTFASANGGTVDVDGRLMTYLAVEPVVDDLDAASRSFTFGATNDAVSLGDDGQTNDDQSSISSSGSSPTVTFRNSAAVAVNAGAGNDTVTLGALDAMFSGAISLGGQNGADRLDASAGAAVTMNGGDGNDTLVGSLLADFLLGGNDNDLLAANPGADTINGGDGNDFLVGAAGADLLNGEAGHDTLQGNNGQDVVTGGLGDDTLRVTTLATIRETAAVNLFLSNNTLTGLGTDTILGQPGAVQLFGTATANVLEAGSWTLSPVTLVGNGGNDTLVGGDLNDLIQGNDGADRLLGRAGNDTIEGGADDDDLRGFDGDDRLLGQQGNDLVNGQAGRDFISGGTGDDTLTGANGEILLEIVEGSPDITLTDSGFIGLGNDTITAFIVAAQIEGDGQDNVLDASGWSKQVTLLGGGGNDFLRGGRTRSLLRGGDGSDTMFGQLASDTMFGDGGNDSLQGSGGNDLLFGGLGDDTVIGNSGNDIILPGPGNDVARGKTGDDVIIGDSGNDTLFGDEGNDRMQGNAGDDFLDGGDGQDTMSGGDGNDTIIGSGSEIDENFSVNLDELISNL